jgi:DNA replication protein DnaC
MRDGMDTPAEFLGQFGTHLTMVSGHCSDHGSAEMLTRMGTAWTCPRCLDTTLKAEKHAIWTAQRSADLMATASIPKKYVGARFAATTDQQRAARQTVQAFRDFILGQRNWAALIMAGQTGTGKTLMACELAQSLINRASISVRYITAKGMVSEIQASYGREGKSEEGEIARFAQYDVLILDEIDALPNRENSLLLLTEIINRRYNDNKPVIVISNQSLALLAQFVGDRVHSRLYENSFPCDFSWEDFRRTGAASRGVLA